MKANTYICAIIFLIVAEHFFWNIFSHFDLYE